MANMPSSLPAEKIGIIDFDFDGAAVAGSFHLARLGPNGEGGKGASASSDERLPSGKWVISNKVVEFICRKEIVVVVRGVRGKWGVLNDGKRQLG